MLAATHLDIITGVDIHIVQPPGPVPPIPIPHPFIGMVVDPFDYLPIVGGTIKVNGFHKAQASTGGNNAPFHIPIGGTFVKLPIGNSAEVFMGSSTVLADGEPFTYSSLPVLSCQCIGMLPPPRAKKKSAKKTFFLPTSMVIPIPKGLPVMVGGAPTISMTAMAFKAGLGALKGLRKLQKSSKLMKKLSKKIHKAAGKAMKKMGVPPGARKKIHRAICAVTGHPVDIATGKVFTESIDFELPGPIPFKWERVWYSTSIYNGPIGHGWHHNYDMALCVDSEEQVVAVRLEDGRTTAFPELGIGEEWFDRTEKLTLGRNENGYFLKNSERLIHTFQPSQKDADIHILRSIIDLTGNRIRFEYDDEDQLIQIVDSAKRIIKFEHGADGRIRTLHAPHPEKKGETFKVFEYEYDHIGNLTEVKNALGHPFKYQYEGHLLEKETNRNGLSFYFEYDGKDENAKCLRTWGDGGIYDHKLTYLEGLTIVENSLGHESKHFHHGGLVYRKVDALGNESTKQYNGYNEIVSETDEEGASTLTSYDDRGNQSKIIFPDGTSLQMEYKDHLLVQFVNQLDDVWNWTYNSDGLLEKHSDPIGNQTHFNYGENQLLQQITYPTGCVTNLLHDAQFNLVSLTTPNGATSKWEYDHLGRRLRTIDAKGNVQRRKLNLLGQVIRVNDPKYKTYSLDYDREGNVIRVKDRDREIRFEYQGMNCLKSRKELNGQVVFKYDTEENLVAIYDEHGSNYQFTLDHRGNIIEESQFDGSVRKIVRDKMGRVATIKRSSGLITNHKYDLLGRLISIKHSDGSEEKYTYRLDGELMSAQNDYTKVLYERDELGRVIKEMQNSFTIESTYDAMGMRRTLKSSLGAYVQFDRDVVGDVTRIKAQTRKITWDAQFNRDIFGLETQRKLPGNVRSIWKRDKLGLPLKQDTLDGNGQKTLSREYAWENPHRLKQITDLHRGNWVFEHDVFDNQISAQYPDGSREYRLPDAVGNLFETRRNHDRSYGKAGQLIASKGVRFDYDKEGNLIQKTENDGSAWQYEWNAAGTLKRVIRPDGKVVSFIYDALGRRIAKQFQQKTTYWLWDGNVLLHEWNDTTGEGFGAREELPVLERIYDFSKAYPLNEHGLTTWLFEPDSFSPLAKLTGNKQYSIVTNHVGTPLNIYDAEGQKTWELDLSIYGAVQNLKGERETCSFRFQGQYEDIETGLYYNRFRYYSPESGIYISKDPIGLRGGKLNIYSYSRNNNIWIDPLGLFTYYQLKDSGGNVIYHGITDRPIQERLVEHANDGKPFSQSSYLEGIEDRASARNLEGSALYHAGQNDTPLLNSRRPVSPGYYHAYDPENLASGRKLLSQAEIDEKMKNAKTVNVNRRGKVCK